VRLYNAIIYVDINCKGLFQNGINFGSSALFNLKSDEVGDPEIGYVIAVRGIKGNSVLI